MRGTKISILLPAKDEAEFISECLESILHQSIGNWEAVIVDDHSQDNTGALVKEFAQKDDRFKLFQNEGEGIIHALRTALKHSTGDLISRMDADDVMYPNKLEVLSKKLETFGENYIAVGGVHYFSEDRVKSGFQNYQNWLNQRTREGTNFDDIFRECPIPSPNWMMFRSILRSIGAFDSDIYPEDYDLAFRMKLAGIKVAPCDEITHHWRDYPTRTSRTHDNYKDHTFTDIKWYYFDKFFREPSKQLVIFGTGFRGKKLAAHLVEQSVHFSWVSHNPEKIGKHIYGVMIEAMDTFDWSNKQIIATIANDQGRMQVSNMARKNGLEIGSDLIHFA